MDGEVYYEALYEQCNEQLQREREIFAAYKKLVKELVGGDGSFEILQRMISHEKFDGERSGGDESRK